jgi:hypothetical protein
MRLFLIIPAVLALLLSGCNTLSNHLVLTAAVQSLPGAYAPPTPVCAECKAEVSRADALAARVPQWMEESRQKAGPDAQVTRTGYFSWEVSTQHRTTRCNATGSRWRCDRELAADFTQQL